MTPSFSGNLCIRGDGIHLQIRHLFLFNKTQNNTSYWRTFQINVTTLNQTYILREAHTRVLQVDIINIGVYTIPLSLGWRESYSQISIFAIVMVMRLLRWPTQQKHFPVIVCRWS